MCADQSVRSTGGESAQIELPHTQMIRQLLDILRPVDQAPAWLGIRQPVPWPIDRNEADIHAIEQTFL